jgi:hypothetical protein
VSTLDVLRYSGDWPQAILGASFSAISDKARFVRAFLFMGIKENP